MPADFLKCVKDGGRVRTKSLGDNKYMRICFIGGKSYSGEVMTKEELEKAGINIEEQFEPPEAGDAPQGVKDILSKAYTSCRTNQFPGESPEAKTRCSKIAWGAVKNAGWHKTADGKWIKEKAPKSENDLSISCEILEKKIDEKKRTVIAGILEEDTLSANDRFYPAHIVRKMAESLAGKRSLIGHDTNNVEDVVAKIESAKISNRIVFGAFRFGTDSISNDIFTKIKEGLIDSTSIRARGQTRRAKINGKFVDVVESLDVASVDWVCEGGVKIAKVVKVFEQAPNIVFEKKEIKKEEEVKMEELKKANEKIAELEKKNKGLTDESKKKDKDLVEEKRKADEAKLKAYIEEKVSKINDDEVRELIKKQLTGKDEKEIDEQFDGQVKYFEDMRKKAGIKEDEIKITPTDQKENKKAKTVNELLEGDSLKKDEKVKVLGSMLG